MSSHNSRRAERRAIQLRGKLVFGSQAMESIEVTDLSEAGAGVVTPIAYPLDAQGTLILLMPESARENWLQIECRVVSCRELGEQSFQVGIQFLRFLQPTPVALRLLRDWAPEDEPEQERRLASQRDYVIATRRALSDALASSDPRARNAANRALQYLTLLDDALPRRRRDDPRR